MNTQLKELHGSYRGPLSTEQLELLRDMQGWIEYCISNGSTLQSTMRVLGGDVNGILAAVDFYRPQTAGYAKYRTEIEDFSALADEPDPNID